MFGKRRIKVKNKLTLTTKILLGLFLGFLFGLVLNNIQDGFIKNTVLLDGVLKVLGNGFTSAIKMMVERSLTFFS